jgi:predicted amidohydrolase
MKIAAAQVYSIDGNIQKNTAFHLSAIQKAAEMNVDYVVFPELSLTGYDLKKAAGCAINTDDPLLKPLRDAAIMHRITIGIGAPILENNVPKIGLIVILGTGEVQTYAKIHLHSGETAYFTEGNAHHTLTIGNTTIANAICADTNHINHVASCAALGAEVYIAGVLLRAQAYKTDTDALKAAARERNLIIGIANHSRPTGGWIPCGRSAFWEGDKLLAEADQSQDALVIAEKTEHGWVGSVTPL